MRRDVDGFTQPPIRRFIALGDSFTEGLDDELRPDGRNRGWADRFASHLDGVYPGLHYANLAVRGKKARQVLEEQVPVAIQMRPDLVSLAVGVNDALRPKASMDDVAGALRSSVQRLRDIEAQVLLFGFGDPSRRSRSMSAVRARLLDYREATLAIADEFECTVVDFWGRAVFDDDVFWSDDRLHLSAEGHALAARAALEAMGLADDSWRTPRAEAPPVRLPVRVVRHAGWAAAHLRPWVMRRLRGVSSGDGIQPKQTAWAPVGGTAQGRS
jgi:lysophospholipase L1-like esterase